MILAIPLDFGDMLQATSGLLTVGDFSALVDGVEGLEFKQLDASASIGGIADGASNAGVNSILVLAINRASALLCGRLERRKL